MSKITQGMKRVANKSTNSDEILGKMRGKYPNLVDLFGGEMDKSGKWVSEPGKLSVWVEEGRIKFCLKPGNGTAIAFGSCLTSEHTLDAIEAAIERDDVEWRQGKANFKP